jgi:hypothetical protein
MKVAIPDTSSDRRVIPITSGSRVINNQKAFLIPSRMRSIFFLQTLSLGQHGYVENESFV